MKSKSINWITSFPKSGNTWVRHFLYAYIHGSASGHLGHPDTIVPPETLARKMILEQIRKGTRRFRKLKLAAWRLYPEFVSRFYFDEIINELAAKTTWFHSGERRIAFKTHGKYDERLIFGRCTNSAVVLLRNPRDVILSAYKHRVRKGNFQGSGADYARKFILSGGDPDWRMPTWEEHFTSWSSQKRFPVEVIQFEEMKTQAEASFSRLVQFLELDFDHDRMKMAIKASSLDSLKAIEIASRSSAGEILGEDTIFFFGTGSSGKSLDVSLKSEGLDALFEEHFRPRIERVLGSLECLRADTSSQRPVIRY